MPFNFNPFPILSTQRLTLRKMKAEDANEIFALRSNDRVLEFLDIEKAVTVDDALKFIEKINKGIDANESILWGITAKGDNKLIGTICLWNISLENNTADIGYMLHPDYQGKGIMQEAVIAVIEFGFSIMNLKAIDADVTPDNLRSVKLLERNGFIFNKESGETIIYSLANPEYGNKK